MQVELVVVAAGGTPKVLQLQAAHEGDARTQAAALGFAVISSTANRRPVPGIAPRGPRATKLDPIVFIEQLRDLLGSGLGVIEALQTLQRGSRGEAAATIDSVERKLREGRALSDAFSETPGFPALLVALVRASELTSDLSQTLTRYLEHEKRVAEIRHRLVSTAIYPLLLIGVGGAVLLFLLFYVMPRFARAFEGMNGELPWSARAMVAWSQALHAHGAWWLLGLTTVVLLAAGVLASGSARAALGRRALDLGVVRRRLRIYFLARWYRATGMLVQGGIPLASSLQLANGLLPAGLKAQGDRVEQGVRQGLSPSQAHVQADMATPVAEQLLLAGERTGDLGSVLARIAHFHEAEVSRSLEQTMRLIEPVVMVLIGLGVGIVVVLMYLPIFELASAIQ